MILWHSGTGNSRYVAESLAAALGQRAERMVPGCKAVAADDSIIVWVFPIYSWGLPPVVRDYIRRSEGLDGARHFMVCTCGDDVGLAHLSWRRLMRSKGWNARGAWSVQMPNNYVLLPGFDVDSKPLERQKLDACSDRIAEVARGIKCGAKVDSVVRGAMPWIKTRVLYPLFVRFMMSPRPFRHNDGCISCGKCAGVCPAVNISMESGVPQWGRDCTMCLGCYHICPRHAVEYGNRTRAKGQYYFPEAGIRRCKDSV